MQLNQVRYFIEAARLLNFTKAAVACNVSQPALTKGIKTLEDELGGPLFHRAPKLCLSDLGKRVMPYLEQTYERADRAGSADPGGADESHSRILHAAPFR
jgi:LysR family hydrogen peroxide-inducible transcriptional activator